MTLSQLIDTLIYVCKRGSSITIQYGHIPLQYPVTVQFYKDGIRHTHILYEEGNTTADEKIMPQKKNIEPS